MRVQVSRCTAGGFHERLDLGAPFSGHFVHFDIRKPLDQSRILQEVSGFICEGGYILGGGDGIPHRENEVNAHAEHWRLFQRNSNVLCRGGDVHHTGRGCHHAA